MAGTDELPIFPLEKVVLFPRVHCPLHIFEPRYRQMAAAALAGDQRIGMVTVRPEHTDEMAGDPPLFEVGCEGRIVESEVFEDGRLNILLLGTGCFRIQSEPPREQGRLYRVARIEPLAEVLEAEETERLAALRAHALDLLTTLVQRASGGKRRLDRGPFESGDAIAGANMLCQTLDLDTPEKQGLLEETRVTERLDRLVGLLEFRLAQLGTASGRGSRTVH